MSLSSDNVFGDGSGASQLSTVTGEVTSGYTMTLNVGLDTTTQPFGGDVLPGGPPPSR
ncbi:hypothetical protein AB0J40_10445 [Amycolatopsis sp. NPDC049691]|uniref:hypothetical protein n=1 Tax=Amycolatopsis sp. NPDC049691 TaxID=3155155 RepID=UPI003447FBFE